MAENNKLPCLFLLRSIDENIGIGFNIGNWDNSSWGAVLSAKVIKMNYTDSLGVIGGQLKIIGFVRNQNTISFFSILLYVILQRKN